MRSFEYCEARPGKATCRSCNTLARLVAVKTLEADVPSSIVDEVEAKVRTVLDVQVPAHLVGSRSLDSRITCEDRRSMVAATAIQMSRDTGLANRVD